MSPILTRPIREQLEHDRIIRQLQSRYKRKHDVAINPGPELNHSVQVGELAVYPDLLLYSLERGRRLEGTVEVETAESVNQLEALAEWGVFSKLKAPFYLYVPPQSIESARRLCDEHQFPVAEIWTYHLSLDQVRFTQVYRSPNAPKTTASPRDGDRDKEKKPAARVAATPARQVERPERPERAAERLPERPLERKRKGEPPPVARPTAAAKPNGRAVAAKSVNGKGVNGKAGNGKATSIGRAANGAALNRKAKTAAKPSRAAAPVRQGRAAKPAPRAAAAAKRPAARKRR